MAIPTYVGSGLGHGSATTNAIALPTGLQTDDILLLVTETANEASTISNAGGGTWTEVTNSPQGTGTAAGLTSTRLTVFWSRYNGTQTGVTMADSGDHNIGQIHAFRGCKTTGNPFNISSGNVDTVSDTSLSATGATTTANDCLVVILAALMDDNQDFGATWTNADLAAITVRQNFGNTAGNDGRIICVTGEKASSGAYGATTNTLTASSVKGMMTVALEGGSSTFTGSGTPAVPAPGIAAVGILTFLGSAALGVSQPSFAATGALIEARTGSAALTVTPPAVAGSAALTFTGSGALLVTPPAIAGSGTQFFDVSATGALTVAAPAIAGTGFINVAITGTGTPTVSAPGLSGSGQLVFPATGALTVTAPSMTASGLESFVGGGDFAVPTTINGTGAESFLGSSAMTVPPPVVAGGQGIDPTPAVARDVRTVALVTTDMGTGAIQRRHGTSIMDTYTLDNDTTTLDDDHGTLDDAPMRYI